MVLKAVERKMLSELIKNSRRSDRELAKAIGTSQPTATRIRNKMEKEGYVREYTAIADYGKVGFSLMALTFVKLDAKTALPADDVAAFRQMHYEAFSENPSAVMLIKRGTGLGYDAVIMSLHQEYSALCRFRNFIRQTMKERATAIETFLINLEEPKGLPFSFNLIASQILASKENRE